MSNDGHVALLKAGVDGWNAWRVAELEAVPDLSGTNLFGADLRGVDLSAANLSGADLRRVNFREANLHAATLDRAQLYRANFNRADLRQASMVGANLYRCYLGRTDMTGADLRESDLQRSILVDVNLEGAHLTGAHVHGLSAWSLRGEPADQRDLVITAEGEAAVTVDNIKVAQCELMQVVGAMTSVPVQPIELDGSDQYATFVTDVKPFPWVLKVHQYANTERLVDAIAERIIAPVDSWLSGDIPEIRAKLEQLHEMKEAGDITPEKFEERRRELVQGCRGSSPVRGSRHSYVRFRADASSGVDDIVPARYSRD